MDWSNCNQIKESIAIERFLEDLGYGSGKKRGKEIVYRSMIREGDNSPSFSVNPTKQKWYDHGNGQGGNIIDLAMLIFDTKSIREVIEGFDKMYGNGILPEIREKSPAEPKEQRPAHKIRLIRPLGSDTRLTTYLESRGVGKVAFASEFLKEVYYEYIKDDGSRKPFFGVGWQNISGGWDVRSRAGKICLFKKDYFLKPGSSGAASIFEGMMDYLSAVAENPAIIDDSVFVLNSLSMSGRVIDFLKSRNEVVRYDLYLDHGEGGRELTKVFLETLAGGTDKSGLYEGYGDYNDKIKAQLKIDRFPQRTPNRRK